MAFVAARAAPASEAFPLEGKFLYAAVAEFADVDVAIAVEQQVIRIFELSRVAAQLAPVPHDFWFFAGGIEYLNAMVTSVSDPQMVILVDGQILGPQELPNSVP